jgi:ribosomal protein S18 acetylase RimI-like enzyme
VPEELRFERFERARNKRELFDCGEPGLNEYLKTRLNQQMKRGVTLGYVLAMDDGRVAGYVTLSNGELPVGVIPEGQGFPVRLPLPTRLVGRLAVDKTFQGRGLGGDLLIHAMRVAIRAAEAVASAVIEVDALNEQARRFYEHYGFARLPDDELHLYLPMTDAEALVQRVFGPNG